MSIKDGRGVKSGDRPTRKYRRQYSKCKKHPECRASDNSIWRKR